MYNTINPESKRPSMDYILSRTSDERTLALFSSIANSGGDRSTALFKAGLTEKQYYGRMSGLIDAGLIKRYKGKYSLTLLGTVVYVSLMTISDAIENEPKIKAI